MELENKMNQIKNKEHEIQKIKNNLYVNRDQNNDKYNNSIEFKSTKLINNINNTFVKNI